MTSVTIQQTPDEFLWTQKYRPKTIDECILPSSLKKTLKAIIESGQVQNVIFAGTAGLGKTTAAMALCETLNLDYLLVNCSEDSGIDVLRNRIRQFASTVSLSGSGSCKVVILDEADYLNATSTQPALRGFIEEFSSSCRFILTCNFKSRLIDPIHSRLPTIEFNCSKKELAGLAAQFMDRLKAILKVERVEASDKVLADLIIRHAPDWREILGYCQMLSATGSIGSEAVSGLSESSIDSLIVALKGKDFRAMRAWVASNNDVDYAHVYRALFDRVSDLVQPQSVPQVVITLADYQYKGAFCADRELNTVACLTEILCNTEWK